MRANGWEMERHEWLPGGASTRRYVRIHAKAGSSAPKTLVGMYGPGGDVDRSREVVGRLREDQPGGQKEARDKEVMAHGNLW